jgi:hypothetical protein
VIPIGLHLIALAGLGFGAASALAMGIDLGRRPQPMAVMNLVWPLAGTFGGPAVVAFYLGYGRVAPRGAPASDRGSRKPAMAVSVAKGALHCGAGCALGDAISQALLLSFPGIAAWFGLGTIFQTETFAAWGLDYVLALAVGIGFQYFAIAPMRGLRLAEGLAAAAKADVLSLTAWQIGMYGGMGALRFGVFHRDLSKGSPLFLVAMQLAMFSGFATSYPVNAWLLARGIKEPM